MSLRSALDSLDDARLFLDRIYANGEVRSGDNVDDAIKAVADARREVAACIKLEADR